jgi:transcription elongation factor, mitochondrial
MPSSVTSKQPGSLLIVNINIQKTQLMAMLCAAMAIRKDLRLKLSSKSNRDKDDLPPYTDTVYFLKSNLASRFYKTYVGNEKVSSEKIVEQILNNVEDESLKNPSYSYVHVPINFKDYWKSVDRVHREYLGQSLLLGLSFFKLCVQKCNKCIALLNRPKKN